MAIKYAKINPFLADDDVFSQLEDFSLDYDIYKTITLKKLNNDYITHLKERYDKGKGILHEHSTFEYWNRTYSVTGIY